MSNEVRIIVRTGPPPAASPTWPAPTGDRPVLPKFDADGLPLTPSEKIEIENKQAVAPSGPPVIKNPQDAINALNDLKAAYENDVNRGSEKTRVPGIPIPPGSGRYVIATGQTAVEGQGVLDMVAATTVVGAMGDLISDLAMQWKDRPDYLKTIVDRFVVHKTGRNQLFDIMRKDDAVWLTDQDQRHPAPVGNPTKPWDVLVAFSEGRKAELAPLTSTAAQSPTTPEPVGPPASPVGGTSTPTVAAPSGSSATSPSAPSATAAPSAPETPAASPPASSPSPGPAQPSPGAAELPPVIPPSAAAGTVPTSGLSDGVSAIIKIHKEHSVSPEAEAYLAGWIARDRQNGPFMLAVVSSEKFEGRANLSSTWSLGLQDAVIEGVAEALKASDALSAKTGIDPNRNAEHNEQQRSLLFAKWLDAAEKVHVSTASESDKSKLISILKAEVAR